MRRGLSSGGPTQQLRLLLSKRARCAGVGWARAALLVALVLAAGLPTCGSAESAAARAGSTTTLSGGVAGSGWENGAFADGAGEKEVREKTLF